MKIQLHGIFTITLVLLLAACVEKSEQTPQKYSLSQFDQVGIVHNRCLDFIAISGSQHWLEPGRILKRELLQSYQFKAMQFFKNENPNLTRDDVMVLQRNFEVITNKGLTILGRMDSNVRADAILEFNKSIVSDLSGFLSPEQNKTLRLIFDVLETNDDIESMLKQLNSIEDTIHTLPVEEQPLIFQALSIAIHSSKYWNENYAAWQNVVNGNAGRTQVRKGVVVCADVGSAICMAAACWFAGPVGWGFAVKAVGCAAAVGSGVAATF